MRFFRRWGYYFHSAFSIIFNFKNWMSLIPFLLNKNKRASKEIKLREPSLAFITRGAMDIWSIKETFLDAFYSRYGIPIADGWQIIDIGAGIGDFSIFAAYNHPTTMIYAFEPFFESYQLLLENIKLNNLKNIRSSQLAIWEVEGHLLLDESAGEPLQVMSKQEDYQRDEHSSVRVKSTTLRQVFEIYNIENLDLLKLDCEGAEYKILMSTPLPIFTKIERIIMEYHDIDENYQHRRLASFLENMGYEVFCYDNFVHEDIGYLYAKRKDAVDGLSDHPA